MTMNTFPDIDRHRATLVQHRPLAPAIVRNLREDLIVWWTYHSNVIEGNTLTLQKTKVALRLFYDTTLDADHVSGEKDDFLNIVAQIVREGFRPYFHALGLPWEENA